MNSKSAKVQFISRAMELCGALSLTYPQEYSLLDYQEDKGVELVALNLDGQNNMVITKLSNHELSPLEAQMTTCSPREFINNYDLYRKLDQKTRDGIFYLWCKI